MATLKSLKKYKSVNEIVTDIVTQISTVSSFNSLVATVPKIVSILEENFKELVGTEKKELVVTCVKVLVEKYVPQEEQPLASVFVETALPLLIDEIVTVANSSAFKKLKRCCK